MEIVILFLQVGAATGGVCFMFVGMLAALVGVRDGRDTRAWADRERARINDRLDAYEHENMLAWPNPFAEVSR